MTDALGLACRLCSPHHGTTSCTSWTTRTKFVQFVKEVLFVFLMEVAVPYVPSQDHLDSFFSCRIVAFTDQGPGSTSL